MHKVIYKLVGSNILTNKIDNWLITYTLRHYKYLHHYEVYYAVIIKLIMAKWK